MVAAAPTSRTQLSRVTLVGERRRADIVLPADTPIGRLLPDILQLLDDRAADRPLTRQLTTSDGSVLPHDSTLASAGVADGAVLRLVRTHAAPPAPVVHDVTDLVADDLDLRAWRWRPAARRVSAGAASVGFGVAAAVLARREFALDTLAAVLGALAVLLMAGGALAARIGGGGGDRAESGGNRGLATALLLASGALAVLTAWTAADAHGWPGALRLAAVAGALVLTLLLLGYFSPLGRGGLLGAGATAALAAAWEAVAAVQEDPARLGTVLALVSVVLLGLLPRLALMASGLTALDDRRSGGTSVSRHEVTNALAATHRGLALATVVTAASAAVGGWLLTRAEEQTVWTATLPVVVTVVLLSRARAFPLVAEVVALLAAASALVVRLVVVWLDHSGGVGPLLVLAAAAVVPLVVLAVEPPEHVRVRLRRTADLVESIGMVALFPLAVGVFGVYGQLLDKF
ncbi:type VII secretion integral membrane protein EccD [Streptomyces clavuligerus]|uniref:Putative integral membrane protein n=5 Tax=Streptomyces clavuligerus TaxID=1901 RepID=E2Q4G7_STRCL|nr:type VII secretion integral membrane protein EccD [Streptomyces clavuligerus]EFG07005.1 putative integral membrane protein [Streptomyces clavuligerus]MBY6304742.1 type VII secretion integral membrane protein EccD [Streptomyces clavuligerus]QCS07487.1 type VII secretion integral membrane protein EccD [Streptomyces clavuligerus]QPJ93168.1 type VII secretion integral membrane protein EccD [Streptomyces clavuligerus]WDN52021.1 type VII secretion integral membrane protein EccD [Streptomyces clav